MPAFRIVRRMVYVIHGERTEEDAWNRYLDLEERSMLAMMEIDTLVEPWKCDACDEERCVSPTRGAGV